VRNGPIEMLRPDCEELQAFYASRRGQLACRLIATQLRLLWPDLKGQTVVGLGYPLPYMPSLDEAERAVALMPAGQGRARWSGEGPSRTALVPEDDLPIEDGAADRVLLIHSLETCAHLQRFLREVWRILADGGRVLAVVPNRRGFWCWGDNTPFGQGQPYSAGQLNRLFRHHLYEPVGEAGALYMPPWIARLWPRVGFSLERVGLRFLPAFSGVLMVEAEKRVAVGPPLRAEARQKRRRYVAVPQGAMARSTEHGAPASRPSVTAKAGSVSGSPARR
jgi:SAM-dependent methyltransferase